MTKLQMVIEILKPRNNVQMEYARRVANKLPKQEIEYYYNRAISKQV